MKASQHAQKIKTTIAKQGERLRVRIPGHDGNADTERLIHFLPQPLSADRAAEMDLEGLQNMANGEPTDFVCAGDEGVPSDAVILYNNGLFLVAGVQPQRLQGVNLLLHCVATRTADKPESGR